MKLWMVNHFAIAPTESGGTRHYSLARALQTHGIETTIIAASSHYQTRTSRPMPEGAAAHPETIEGVPYLWLRSNHAGAGSLSRLLAMLDFAKKIICTLAIAAA